MTSSPTVAIAAAVLGTPFRVAFGGSTLYQYAEDVAKTLLLASRAAPAGARRKDDYDSRDRKSCE